MYNYFSDTKFNSSIYATEEQTQGATQIKHSEGGEFAGTAAAAHGVVCFVWYASSGKLTFPFARVSKSKRNRGTFSRDHM